MQQLPRIWKKCLTVSIVLDGLVLAGLIVLLTQIMLYQYAWSLIVELPVASYLALIFGLIASVFIWVTKMTLIAINRYQKKVQFFTTIVVLFFLTGGIIGTILAIIAIANYNQIHIGTGF